jgi:glycosyltransferase involved in cell wall biosynthesis
MYKGAKIAVVVPAYNEAEFVGGVIDGVPAFVDRIYPVDDCSTDETWAEILAATSRDQDEFDGSRVSPSRHERNRGVGAAIKSGYRRALEDGMEVIAVMNGDGQMDPAVLHRILDPVVEGEAGYAKGNRLTTPERRRPMSHWRLFGNFLLTTLTRIASGYWQMADSQNGYTAISADTLERIDLEALYDGYGFLNDVLVRLNIHEVPIADVEMDAVYGDEVSRIKYHRFVPVLSWLLLGTFFERLERKYVVGEVHPIAVFHGLGALLSLFVVAVSVLTVSDVVAPIGNVRAMAGLSLTSFLLIGLGTELDSRRNRDLATSVRNPAHRGSEQ